jgi:DNA-binding SARP family transcriptional activator
MRFALLGPLVVAGDPRQQASLAAPRLRVLLAALLLRANTPVSAHALAEAVWDGALPPAAIQTLRS